MVRYTYVWYVSKNDPSFVNLLCQISTTDERPRPSSRRPSEAPESLSKIQELNEAPETLKANICQKVTLFNPVDEHPALHM